jgi:predicted aspartyl protease
MTGVVGERLEAVLPLRVRGTRPLDAGVEAIIDTGFTEYLTLSREVVEALGMRFRESGEFVMADGTKGVFDLYECTVTWHGRCWRWSPKGAP